MPTIREEKSKKLLQENSKYNIFNVFIFYVILLLD